VIDEIARYAGVYKQVESITHRAMNGELDFNQSLEQRVALLKGTHQSVFDKVIANLIYTDGVRELCRSLKKLGYRLAVISGGFKPVTEHVRKELGLDYDYANQLEETEDGYFTGRTVGPVVNAQRKADLLMTIAQKEGITLDQCVAIGDGSNDLPMLGTAGLGIAFNAKPAVQSAARFRIVRLSIMSKFLEGFLCMVLLVLALSANA
jgi:phosphoserine phosphatase SerB